MPLAPRQIEAYRELGYVSPVDAFSRQEVDHWRKCFEGFEKSCGEIIGTPMQFRPHLHQAWANEIVRRPEILDPIESLIGPDILVYHLTIWVKEPHSESFVSWHQDSTFFALEPYRHVTAWVALTDASEAMGCMRMIPRSHTRGEVPLCEVRPNERLMLRAGHRVDIDEADEEVEAQPLAAGQISLHHTLTLHSSGPNQTNNRRIGLGISYIPADCRCIARQRVNASLVRGRDRYNHFELEARFDPTDHARGVEQHRQSLERWNMMREEVRPTILERLVRR